MSRCAGLSSWGRAASGDTGSAARWTSKGKVMPVTELRATDFATFFNKLWGHPPFAWQQELADRVLGRTENPWPDAIALPTASGHDRLS